MHHDLKLPLVAAAVVTALVAVFGRIQLEIPLVGHVGGALIAITMLYAPFYIAWRRGHDVAVYGFRMAPIRRGLGIAAIGHLVVFPLFIAGFLVFYRVICDVEALRNLAPQGMCARFVGWAGAHAPQVDWALLEWMATQLIVVALPEELFYRGFLLYHLEKALPPKRRFLGGGIGWALVISAALFAVVHLPKNGDPRDLATFFPGLMFGWMRSATGSILASTVVHASSNILIRMLSLSLFR